MPGDIAYGKAVLIAFDQTLNAIGGGWPDETLSSRAWRWHVDGARHWPCRLIDRVAALLPASPGSPPGMCAAKAAGVKYAFTPFCSASVPE